jgi:hypothetical protein
MGGCASNVRVWPVLNDVYEGPGLTNDHDRSFAVVLKHLSGVVVLADMVVEYACDVACLDVLNADDAEYMQWLQSLHCSFNSVTVNVRGARTYPRLLFARHAWRGGSDGDHALDISQRAHPRAAKRLLAIHTLLSASFKPPGRSGQQAYLAEAHEDWTFSGDPSLVTFTLRIRRHGTRHFLSDVYNDGADAFCVLRHSNLTSLSFSTDATFV